MVAIERRTRAETEEELEDLKQEKEALRSALRLIEGENTTLRGPKEKQMIACLSPPPSRSSSRMTVKSRPASLNLFSTLPPLPPSLSPFDEDSHPIPTNVLSPEEESQPTTGSRRGSGGDPAFRETENQCKRTASGRDRAERSIPR